MYNLSDADLGLLCRSVSKIGLDGYADWGTVVGYLGKRLAMVEDGFVVEGVVELLLCLPYQKEIYDVVDKNIGLFSKYKW